MSTSDHATSQIGPFPRQPIALGPAAVAPRSHAPPSPKRALGNGLFDSAVTPSSSPSAPPHVHHNSPFMVKIEVALGTPYSALAARVACRLSFSSDNIQRRNI
ncbi:hypothetical protein PC9H_006086 [Pleurotus ostreatus]|uniref:Uncharacterized protein n=1 Tax=Pleurotus ostreatus TaxID=5322 RepID=A0A8H7DSJ6_PLEOS|nr:uncharacterized protein PC9H_006086 [Pleurotus ostreatus]KAF7430381.1 hypothetical protein PC9H_006086 [Pleurotus ostreatus]